MAKTPKSPSAADAASAPVHLTLSVLPDRLPQAVSALTALGVSATISVAGPQKHVMSAIQRLTERGQMVSAAVSLRGTKPVGG